VHLGEVGGEGIGVVEGAAGSGARMRQQGLVVDRRRRLGQAAVAVVVAATRTREVRRTLISRRKSSAANLPSPSLSGSVFELAASDTPCSTSRLSSDDMSTVSPGSSSSNSSMQTRW
jgi:hypothetical protein